GRDLVFVGLDTTTTAHDAGAVREALAAFPESAFVAVFTHWGNEYEATHSSAQETFAHLLIDSGADLVVGAHPHVVQDVEIYKGKHIYYSLGNFVFDQYWNDAVQTGLMVLVTLDDDRTAYQELSIKSVRSQPTVTEVARLD
ncbi:MAG TPA: CapA family protein, partial [Candidatus Paceibacterota bacterium]|nr:CapA family protein [Candidatus Paceibacterota bacterium]